MSALSLHPQLETSNRFLEIEMGFKGWRAGGSLTSHARVLLCIAHDPGARLCDTAASVGITERSAYGIVTDLTEAGYVVKQKDAAATATRSRRTCRCPNLPARNPPSATFSPSPRAPARDRS
jgi:hypothetical protein